MNDFRVSIDDEDFRQKHIILQKTGIGVAMRTIKDDTMLQSTVHNILTVLLSEDDKPLSNVYKFDKIDSFGNMHFSITSLQFKIDCVIEKRNPTTSLESFIRNLSKFFKFNTLSVREDNRGVPYASFIDASTQIKHTIELDMLAYKALKKVISKYSVDEFIG